MLYTPNEHDTVHKVHDLPPPDPGAPLPLVMASEERLILAYYSQFLTDEPHSPQVIEETTAGNVVVVKFLRPVSYFSVPLSDEILDAHPLAFRGLSSYAVFKIDNSSWIRRLVAAQYVHPRPLPQVYENSRHYAFVFHDSVFECVADGYEYWASGGSIEDALERMIHLARAPRR